MSGTRYRDRSVGRATGKGLRGDGWVGGSFVEFRFDLVCCNFFLPLTLVP